MRDGKSTTAKGCAEACHRGDGNGHQPAFPSIVGSPWVTQDSERLIKMVLYGLMGPLEVNGKKFDGQVPMTPFGGMLKDDEIAAVLTFVRNHFDNKGESHIKRSRSKQFARPRPAPPVFHRGRVAPRSTPEVTLLWFWRTW
ncbi:MAG: cytochrome c [Verrucomicrobiales bacterium]